MSGTLLLPHRMKHVPPLLVCIHGGGCNGGYFDFDASSAAPMAAARGIPVLLVHRPGHAGNPRLGSDRPLARSVPVIWRFIDAVRAELGLGSLLLLGHSSGGAIALMLASRREAWPIAAVAVSGVGDEPSPEVRDWKPDDGEQTVQHDAAAAALFFGPAGSYHWKAPGKLRLVAEPWHVDEVLEILRIWPGTWREIAGMIDVPVQLRLAENDRLWRHEPEIVRRMAESLQAAPTVDAAILPEGGHLYELHRRGPQLVRQQLEFLQACGAGAFRG